MHFIGQIQAVYSTEEYTVKFLQKCGINRFSFPCKDDISLVLASEIITKLPKPSINNSWRDRYAKTVLGEQFYHTTLTATDDSKIAVFVSPTVCNVIRRYEAGSICLQMDATFKVVPRAGGALQLFIIHIYVHETMIWICKTQSQSQKLLLVSYYFITIDLLFEDSQKYDNVGEGSEAEFGNDDQNNAQGQERGEEQVQEATNNDQQNENEMEDIINRAIRRREEMNPSLLLSSSSSSSEENTPDSERRQEEIIPPLLLSSSDSHNEASETGT
ncbi:unnamed protein product [Phaedon cochleariae]|uniref:Uncharacterized protein n=1 Tax=Phaedon cochleariae TaxID=80249 RepID=A0A9N9SL93_PHACE|nr:unnamed protein product [Phaedon cochleariae]